MKQSILAAIFNGDKGNMEIMRLKRGKDKNADEVCRLESELQAKIGKEMFDLYQKIVLLFVDDCCDEVDFFMSEGFKLGLLVGIESMQI